VADHFRVIAHNWWRILLASALVGGAVYFLSARAADVYQASALLSVTAGQPVDSPTSREQTVFLADTYAERATTRPVLQAAAEASDLGITAGEAGSRLSASSSGTLGFLTVESTGPKPRDASKLANADAEALIAEVNTQQDRLVEEDLAQVNTEIADVARQLNALAVGAPERDALEVRYQALLQAAVDRRTQPRNRIELVSSAEPAASPSSPRPLRNGALGFAVALVITAELSVALHLLSNRLPRKVSAETVGQIFRLPVLASIPSGSANDSTVVEAFRVLRTSVLSSDAGTPASIAITSANPRAGKSFTSINLAQSLAAQQPGVVLVDGDL